MQMDQLSSMLGDAGYGGDDDDDGEEADEPQGDE